MRLFLFVLCISFVFAKESITVCYSDGIKPYLYTEQSKAKGMSIDFVNVIAKHANLEVNYHLAKNFDEHIKLTKKGVCDLAPLIVQKPNVYDFLIPTKPYSFDYLALVTQIEAPFLPELNDLKNKTIAINRSYKNVIELIRQQYPSINFVLMSDEEALKKVQKGELFGYINGYLVLAYKLYNQYHGQLKIMKTLGDTKVLLSLGVNEQNKHLIPLLNTAIEKITTKEKSNINGSWKSVNHDKLFDYALLYQLLGLIAIVLAFFLYKQWLLKKLNRKLSIKVNQQVKQNRKKDRLLFQQAKLASMGEMINNIAHQWRQPLNEINSIVMNIDYTLITSNIKNDSLETNLQRIEAQTQYMSNTIENFRNYFRTDKTKELFLLSDAISHSLDIVRSGFEEKGIEITLVFHKDQQVLGYLGEFIQVIITLLNNAKDALVEREVEHKHISITINESIFIEDNAGGIKADILDRIFEPYFTTKHPSQGTGIGLHMAKMILEESMKGSLHIQNTTNGALCIIKVAS